MVRDHYINGWLENEYNIDNIMDPILMHKQSFVSIKAVNLHIRGYPLSFVLNLTYRPIVSFHPFLASSQSKNDIFRKDHQLLIVGSPSLLCAVSAMHSNILTAFQFEQYLTRLVVIHLRDTVCYTSLSYKSLRALPLQQLLLVSQTG